MNHQNLGMMWSALIQQHYQIDLDHPLPGHLVARMMVALKLCRLAFTPGHEDSIRDARVYAVIAEECEAKELT